MIATCGKNLAVSLANNSTPAFLKEKDLGHETPQESVAQEECLEVIADRGEFLLHTTDENSEAFGGHWVERR